MSELVPLIGVILAGGLARRMGGGDKPLRMVGGKPILYHVVARLAPQCDCVILNANGDPARFASYGLPVVADTLDDHPGPLAGILAALDWTAENHPDAEFVASVAGDCPFLPKDLISRLEEARRREDADLAVAASGGRSHPVIGLWKVALRGDLRTALVEEGLRKIDLWTARYRLATVSWAVDPVDPFFNANTADDLEDAERMVAAL